MYPTKTRQRQPQRKLSTRQNLALSCSNRRIPCPAGPERCGGEVWRVVGWLSCRLPLMCLFVLLLSSWWSVVIVDPFLSPQSTNPHTQSAKSLFTLFTPSAHLHSANLHCLRGCTCRLSPLTADSTVAGASEIHPTWLIPPRSPRARC